MFIISSRVISESNKMKSSILKNLIDYIKHYRAASENDVIRFKCLSKIMIFKSGVYTASAFLYFYYDKYVC